jgi:hypothetical protein
MVRVVVAAAALSRVVVVVIHIFELKIVTEKSIPVLLTENL